jgi:hypothetical protein
MYWDIVEVAPKVGYSLFVRFKDGLEGMVHLRPEQLTGALEPVRDEDFFKRAFIDGGAVAWPGEIDLAPDAMYAEISGRRRKTELLVQQRSSGCGPRACSWIITPSPSCPRACSAFRAATRERYITPLN